ncbi:MAG: NAD(P)/FAD-dependent oxidoreductase [Rhodococcus sp. (in: high G+C Gram-positive bacteria)]|uniref:flavin-containing monooxygenase n=1 Tax=Rhodococcus sp. TaxID=1831 RepID=UPI002ADB5BBA|nr:NAD(P)/FAD-dependent oxidoreductase [Rhodococcus sp. (in: high G+C Gram-positive bacteria)]
MSITPLHTVIVGAGFSGIGAAIRLDQAGLPDWLILEDGDDVGGTWHWNTYPGVAVDIPSFSYQFSFAQRSDWSRTYAPGRELERYARDLVDRHGLRPRIRFNTRVLRASWDEQATLWRLQLADGGSVSARFLLNASGVLTTPKLPDIAGIDQFTGTLIHTARWDHSAELAGKRVAVIGTGASAVQLIPELAPITEHLTVFQRTPIWCFPKPDFPLGTPLRVGLRAPGARLLPRLASQAFVEVTFPLAAHFHTWFPLARHGESVGRWWLRQQVRDPMVRAQLTPAYGLGCKRPSFHNSYLATYNRPDVTLQTSPIQAITETGIDTVDGAHHRIDVLVAATGFKVMETDNIPTYDLVGADGETLEQFWDRHRMQAYAGISVPGFPNFFTVFGPYGYNGSSYFALIEAQTHHIVRCLSHARNSDTDRVEIRPEANARYFATMMKRRHKQAFYHQDCAGANSYYFDKHGDVPLRSATTAETMWHARVFPLEDYRFDRTPTVLHPSRVS